MNMTLQPIINKVLALQSYAPNDDVNSVMGSLVQQVINSVTINPTEFATYQQVIEVQHISAETESELEKFWARRIVASDSPDEMLNTFPYLDNYRELAEREITLIKHSGLTLSQERKALIIGSGPLPLSAYELNRQSGVAVDHVDSSKEAIRLCRQVTKKIGISSRYYQGRGETVVLQDTYDLILIAALAGATAQDKQRIVDTVLPHISEDGRIVVRSARGPRTLLYPGVLSSDIRGVRLMEEYHPTDYIINSVFVYGR